MRTTRKQAFPSYYSIALLLLLASSSSSPPSCDAFSPIDLIVRRHHDASLALATSKGIANGNNAIANYNRARDNNNNNNVVVLRMAGFPPPMDGPMDGRGPMGGPGGPGGPPGPGGPGMGGPPPGPGGMGGGPLPPGDRRSQYDAGTGAQSSNNNGSGPRGLGAIASNVRSPRDDRYGGFRPRRGGYYNPYGSEPQGGGGPMGGGGGGPMGGGGSGPSRGGSGLRDSVRGTPGGLGPNTFEEEAAVAAQQQQQQQQQGGGGRVGGSRSMGAPSSRGSSNTGRPNNLRYEERDYGEYVTNLRNSSMGDRPPSSRYGNAGGMPPPEELAALEEELQQLRKENDLLKRSCRDLINNFNELSNRLFDVDESLKKVAKVFPEEEEMDSLEWLLRR